jgi:hypothetical protein
MEVTKWLKPSISVSRIGDSASVQAATRVNAEQASKGAMRRSAGPFPIYPDQQTSSDRSGWSVWCQNRTHVRRSRPPQRCQGAKLQPSLSREPRADRFPPSPNHLPVDHADVHNAPANSRESRQAESIYRMAPAKYPIQ